jgi:ABC-type antimicrobial peptide transport system permease subunit
MPRSLRALMATAMAGAAIVATVAPAPAQAPKRGGVLRVAEQWGGMLSATGRSYMVRAPWLSIFPGLALTLAIVAFNILGDALRDLLDPRLRTA